LIGSRGVALWLAFLGLAASASSSRGNDPPTTVEPAELAKNADLIGRELVVDDRLKYFQIHGKIYDEFYLRRTPIPFRLPARLQTDHPPRAVGILVEGVLKRAGDRLVFEVSAYQPLASDLDRLKAGIKALPETDYQGRYAWARWAEQRAKAFEDKDLLSLSALVEAEAIHNEAERFTADPVTHWMTLARKARQRNVPEPLPSALAHRAFNARLSTAKSAEELKALRGDIEAFFPDATKPAPSDEGREIWMAPYAADPYSTYLKLPPPTRAIFDRRLWAETTQRLFEARAAADPLHALSLADEAETQLPDRPEVAKRLVANGLDRAKEDVGALRQTEVEALAKLYRERLNQPAKAKELLRGWLNDRRKKRLSPTDAEGRVLLAAQFQALVQDRETAVALLQEAWRIDPASQEVPEALLRLGLRKVEGQWIDPSRAKAVSAEESAPGVVDARSSLLGLDPREVRGRLGGKPNQIVYSATQGEVIEQWIYWGPRENQYVNFVRRSREARPKVVAYYSLPRAAGDSEPAP
jgi:hypothetical protein